MNILFVGDVVGAPGRRALGDALTGVIDRHRIDFTIVNIENAAGGFGLTVELFEDLSRMPIDVFSSGNHIWDKREIYDTLNSSERLLRPANYPPGNPGRGSTVQTTAAGVPVGVLNLQGQVFMPVNADSPFRVADEELAKMDAKIVFVDFHAEATSEKMAIGWYLDGRVSAVVGTHTHVATADETIRPGGTAYLSDVGMTGAYDGIIGFSKDRIIEKFLSQTPRSFETAKKDIRLSGVVIAVNEETGRATAIERVQVRVD
ncbi:MAG TPA: TIGR00282 family metallophosphoesterase [Thermoanaerobaculia bacterium]|jgi:2',3'-cyclic-nucleotide 2'-phosphodiesterase|nr:TIGR00282 family metallophosphoesterase [Thermoanaerobaculia bacterium]